MYVYVCVCVCVCIYIYIYTYIYTDIYTHDSTGVCILSLLTFVHATQIVTQITKNRWSPPPFIQHTLPAQLIENLSQFIPVASCDLWEVSDVQWPC